MPDTTNSSQRRQLMTFAVGGARYGLHVEQVLEVLSRRPLTPVPLAPRAVAGLMNLRGQIVTAIDLGVRLQLDPRAIEAGRAMNVVIRQGDAVASLLVDSIGDVIDVDEGAFQTPPETLEGSARELILGAYRLEDGLILLLDSREILDLQGENEPC